MKSSEFSTSSAELDSRAARFGLRVGASLTEHSKTLPHDVTERLRFARERAVARASQARAAANAAAAMAASPRIVGAGPTLALNGGPRQPGSGDHLWSMLVSALPLLLLAAGLLLMQQGQVNEQIAATAEVDTALLSDRLPPSAFTDPGFAEYLRDAEE